MSAQHPPCGRAHFAWHPSANGHVQPPRGLRYGGSLPIPPGAVMPAEHPPSSGVCSPFVRPRTPALTPLRGCAYTCSISEGGACHLRGRSLASPKSATFLHSTCFNCTPSTPPGRVPPHSKQPPPLRPLGGWGSFGNILRVPLLRPPAVRVLPSEICLFACKFPTECIYAILSAPKCINIHFTFCAPGSSGRAQ